MIATASDIQFVIADPSDDTGIRALLRETPMKGDIQISLQREPDCFAAARIEGQEHRTIVGVDRRGQITCVGAASVRDRYINGASRRVAYLGQLRLAQHHAGRADLLRRGFAFLRDALAELDLDACFTSIATDNLRAIRFLEAGVRGMPLYRAAGELITLLFTTSGHRRVAANRGTIERLSASSALHAPRFQLAPAWANQELLQLHRADVLTDVICSTNGSSSCAGLFDLRQLKQTVVTGYSRRFAFVRPLYNRFASSTGRLKLPAAGTTLNQAFVCPLAAPSEDAEGLSALLEQLLAVASERGAEILALGLDARDPRVRLLRRRFKTRAYRTRIYMVSWSDSATSSITLDDRLLLPEVALL